jgi:two-component system CheB/CheR fusion protein
MGDPLGSSAWTVGPDQPAGLARWLVIVGSSAGGIESLSALLRGLGEVPDLAIVIAQHLSPAHLNPLAEILGRETALEVVEVADADPLVAGRVHVTPPGSDIAVVDGALSLTPAPEAGTPRPSIDGLMRSAARSWGDRSVGVILSGTGTDGAAGMRAIKAAGGVTIVQEPRTAKFPAMPRAAIGTGSVDLVAPAEEIGELLRRACGAEQPAGADGSPGWTTEALAELVDAVRSATGVDFAEYKSGTLQRQIGRRQAITGLSSPAEYLAAVSDDPTEARFLMRRMFVSVTAFFRDPAAWERLRVQVDALVARTDRSHQFRVWVPGCATGEEAYTVAMVFADALGRPADLSRRLRIFASDLDEVALDVARQGRYDASEAADIPAEAAEAWVVHTPEGLEVSRVLRDCIVFARHDVTIDPPFPRIDLISLRNTLIYFQPSLQERLLRLCSFALGPSGILFLGEAESVSTLTNLFVPLDEDHPIYQRMATTTLGPFPTRATTEHVPVAQPPAARGSDRSRRQLAVLSDVLKLWAPPLLVVNDADEVVQVVGDVSPWCWVADGPYTSQVTTLMRDDLQPVVSSLLLRLHHGEGSRHARRVATADGTVEVTARRLDGSDEVFAVISFDSSIATPGGVAEEGWLPAGGATLEAGMISEAEYLEAHDEQQQTIEDLTAANEEMQALNEEFQATAEELQASSEEISASNEELATLNEELGVRTGELEASNLDLKNIQRSLDTGIILLDADLRIRSFNPLAVRLFALIDDDLGRPLTSVATTAPVPDLERLLERVAREGTNEVVEVAGESADYLLRLGPYVDAKGTQLGVTLTVTDVSAITEIRRTVDASLAELEHVVESIDELIWMTGADGEIVLLGPQVTTLFGLDRAEVLARASMLDEAVIAEDRHLLAVLATDQGARWRGEYRIRRPDGQVRWISGSSTAISADEAGGPATIRTALDVTDRHEGEARSTTRLHLYESVFNTEAFGVIAVDADGVVATCNATFAAMVSSTPASLVGRSLDALMTFEPDPTTGSGTWLETIGPLAAGDHRLLSASGPGRWVALDVRPVPAADGQEAAAIIVVVEVTALRESQRRLTRGAHVDEQTGIANRSWFNTRLEEELARSARSGRMAALASIDLDGFKEVNDQFGHAAGDVVLREVAARLRRLGRRQDVVGRIGGDEFALLLGGVEDEQEIGAVADRVLDSLREPIDLGTTHTSLTASVGIALAPNDGSDASTLLHSADVAMYHAKRSGRDCWSYFSPEMNVRANGRAQMRQQLAEAIGNRDFTMRYQPMVSLATGAVVAAESLVRWTRGDEIVAASAFIALAEETFQLRGLGHLIMDLLDADLARLGTTGGLDALPISLNLAVSQLEDPDLVDLMRAWKPTGGHGRLIIEVTETALLEHGSAAMRTLSTLRDLGATICIDDFGSGYASLGQLDVARASIIKFDRTLLRRASDGPFGRALFSAAADLVRAIGSRVVVEGIETAEDLALAAEVGAEWVQGYYVAEPMAIEDLATWVAGRTGWPEVGGLRTTTPT